MGYGFYIYNIFLVLIFNIKLQRVRIHKAPKLLTKIHMHGVNIHLLLLKLYVEKIIHKDQIMYNIKNK